MCFYRFFLRVRVIFVVVDVKYVFVFFYCVIIILFVCGWEKIIDKWFRCGIIIVKWILYFEIESLIIRKCSFGKCCFKIEVDVVWRWISECMV